MTTPEEKRQASKAHYHANKADRQRASRQKYYAKIAIVRAAKDRPCMDCGVKYPPYVMDLDHVRGEKKDALSIMVRSRSVDDILAEIEKCDVVCSNCHRERTFKTHANGNNVRKYDDGN